MSFSSEAAPKRIRKKLREGIKETFIPRYLVEKASKTEIRPEEQSEKAESCRENLWNEIQLKGS